MCLSREFHCSANLRIRLASLILPMHPCSHPPNRPGNPPPLSFPPPKQPTRPRANPQTYPSIHSTMPSPRHPSDLCDRVHNECVSLSPTMLVL